MNNMFVSYDLIARYETSDYARVEGAILAHDPQAVRLLYTVWYMKSPLPVEALQDVLSTALDSNDRLIVIHATAAAASNAQGWENLAMRWNR
jgi:hypothetical protein